MYARRILEVQQHGGHYLSANGLDAEIMQQILGTLVHPTIVCSSIKTEKQIEEVESLCEDDSKHLET